MALADPDSGEGFLDLVNAYRQKFNELPDLWALNVPPEKVKAALKQAISSGRPFTTEEWEKEMNIKKPPPGAFT
jgi:hypothetical protein